MISLWHHQPLHRKIQSRSESLNCKSPEESTGRILGCKSAFLLNQLNYHVIIQVPSARNISVFFSWRMSASEVVIDACRSIGNDWTNFLAFYLVVSILSPGISVLASHRGDRFLSRIEETRCLTRFSVTPPVWDLWIALLPRDQLRRDPSFDCAFSFLLRFIRSLCRVGGLSLLAGSQRDIVIFASAVFIVRKSRDYILNVSHCFVFTREIRSRMSQGHYKTPRIHREPGGASCKLMRLVSAFFLTSLSLHINSLLRKYPVTSSPSFGYH